QRLQKGNLSYKKVRTCGAEKNPYNEKYREQNSTLNTQYGGTNLWHSRISLDGMRSRMRHRLPLVVLPAALLTSRKRNLPLAVLPAVLATSPLRLPPPVALLTSRKKNPAPVVLPVVLAISKSFHSH